MKLNLRRFLCGRKEENLRKEGKGILSHPSSIYTSILEGQKACYGGQTLDIQWCWLLINLLFSLKEKPVKRVHICSHISTVHISSSDVELHKVISLETTAAHPLFNDQMLLKLGLPPRSR